MPSDQEFQNLERKVERLEDEVTYLETMVKELIQYAEYLRELIN